jgi:beta propeller repeat protein
MYFLSQDVSPVKIYDSLNGASFGLALPFSLSIPGTYQLSFYSVDTSGHQETNHNVTLVLPGAGSLGFDSVSVSPAPIYNPGAALSVRPGTTPITFHVSASPTAVNAQLDVFQGVAGWATVSNAPASPTASAAASITVGGQNVDFYEYQLNANTWSAEFPASSPLTLSNLPQGTNTLSVLGRSQYGAYLDPSNAVTVGWVVDPAAPPTTITGAPATPAAAGSAQLTVAGAGVTNYQWTINSGYYRAPSNVASLIVLSNLSAAPQAVGVLGEVNGVYQPTNNPTTVSWVINPLYGYDLSSLPAVRSVTFTNVAGATTSFNWDGRNDAGVIEPPGWYTVRIALSDGLGNTNFTVSLAQIGAFSGTNQIVADFPRGAQNPYARGRWVVWQDQSDGNSDIYAQDLTTANSLIVPVTHATTIQQNPRTDGRYVVWQAQQPNGSWDVYLDDLDGNTGPQAVTSTPGLDEVNPAIWWPWVAYQVRPTGNTTAAWQLFAQNLLTSQSFAVSPSTQDEVDADVQAARVVWQDFRDQGPGEIYFADLRSGAVRRITTNIFAQQHPAVYDNWIVWQDNRNVELDIYGFDLLRNREIQITRTPYDETQPFLNGPWLVCAENSLGAQTGNAQLVHLPSLVVVPVTQTATLKALPTLADGRAVRQETISGQTRIVAVALPSLQPVFQNRNVVAVTPALAAYGQNAYGLLSLWAGSGVQSLTQYTSLVPQVASQTASWNNGAPSGPNFILAAGAFLWVKFNSGQVLDLGVNNTSPLNLSAGANVFGYTGFPDSYSAYQLLRQIGLGNALSARMLDAQSGLWLVAEVQNGNLAGNDFPIPNVAVLMVNLAAPVPQFTPQAQ